MEMTETQTTSNPNARPSSKNAATLDVTQAVTQAVTQSAGQEAGISDSTSNTMNDAHQMRVRKRDGSLAPVNVQKIVDRVTRCCAGLTDVDPYRVAIKAISGLYDGATTKELDDLCIATASLLIGEEPQYSALAARLLSLTIEEEVRKLGVRNFTESIEYGHNHGIVATPLVDFVRKHHAKIEDAINLNRTNLFEYFGLRTVYDRYLLKDPKSRLVFETPQYFFMRVACGLAQSPDEAIQLYNLISRLDYMPSTPTLFNSGTLRPQMSSCYLLDSPGDDLGSIYKRYMDIALLSKFAGGIGVAYHRVRARGSHIKGTNGHSNGIVPWLKTLDSSVAAVNQGGKRKGACCVYLETWHADIEEFLDLRENTGDEAKRTHNLNLANWVPDLFMRRVEEDGTWSLFDPKAVPALTDLYGAAFEQAYVQAENEGLFARQVKARDLYARMMKSLAQTGNGWMTFKDASNKKSNQTLLPQNVIHLSNLCTEILEITNEGETAVCNLGSVNLARHIENGEFDFEKLASTVRTAMVFLDRVVDINFYPIPEAASSNQRWRPVGLGVMGLQDAFFKLRLPFDSAGAMELSRRIQEEIYYNALLTSCELAEKYGPHPAFHETRASIGQLQFDLWGITPSDPGRWALLRERIKKSGLRNSLCIAIAPTATIASIVGSYESIEPMVSNLFKRETLSGEFLQVNKYLVSELKARGLWSERVRNEIKMHEGSIQSVTVIPEDIRHIYRTAWELPMKALIDMAAERGAYIDQSASLNLFMESPTIGKLSSMYMYAWKRGIKTTYYLRSRPATSISKVTVEMTGERGSGTPAAGGVSGKSEASAANNTGTLTSAMEVQPQVKKSYSDAEAIACSLENPEACEACT
ncbi:MAG: ribonucleoside-diphosphate reductase subunit alpha [Bdellovibrionaceae bacterium]|nr:ribonucleoside-diphosphate reductase subunit alpha [Pseudobdellovibrionaceae bacterium]